jgi:hypothetical protein
MCFRASIVAAVTAFACMTATPSTAPWLALRRRYAELAKQKRR